MSSAVLTRPDSPPAETGWIELDDVDATAEWPVESDAEFIELEPDVTVFETQERMRFGPRAYTRQQADVIELAVRHRKPLPAPPLPLDE